MTPAEILRKAADKLDQGWTQGVMARDARGERVNANDPAACAWCAMGSICAVAPEGGDRAEAIDALELYLDEDIIGFNDDKWTDAGQVKDAMRAVADQLEAENG